LCFAKSDETIINGIKQLAKYWWNFLKNIENLCQ
jgi:hypothetical protein